MAASSLNRTVASALLPALLLVGLEAAALAAPPQAPMLGRKNPFRPLVLVGAQPMAAAPDLPAPPRPAPRPERQDPEIAYLGLAYDGTEAVAAVKVGGKVRFVRRGEEVAGATLQAVSPRKLVWQRGQRRLESPLHHRPGAHTP